MCGIAGVVDFHSSEIPGPAPLETMTRCLSHRGPDGLSTWIGQDGVGLGCARLAVIDPEDGGQPMVYTVAGRSWVLTYNGELYNAAELRQRLISLGHKFRTRSDTEVVLAAFAEWGERCLERLNGIFAFALYDVREKTVFLARDRLGVKPLFFYVQNGRFLFASEIKALLEHPEVSPEVGMDGLAELLLNHPVRTPGQAIFRNVEELRPGSWLRVSREGIRSQVYWDLPTQPHEDDEEKTVRCVRELLQDAVQSQLTADVPVCTLLSGGLDSSTVTALAAACLKGSGNRILSTFAVDYAENDQHFADDGFHSSRDLPFVEELVRFLGTDHHSLVVTTSQILSVLKDSLKARDLPTTGDMDASLYLLCKRVKQTATVALSGEGSDELFGGYWGWALEDGRLPRTPGRFPWMLIGDTNTWLLRSEIVDLIRPAEYVQKLYEEAVAKMPQLPKYDAEEVAIRPVLHILRTRFLHMLLERQDRMSMAAGVETRVPFLDHRLVKYVWNIPGNLLAMGGVEKGLLRRAMADLLPADICSRPKNAFPSSHDPLLADTLRFLLQRQLRKADSPMFQVFSRDAVKKVIAMPRTNHFFYRGLLWFLVQFDTWMRQYRIRIV